MTARKTTTATRKPAAKKAASAASGKATDQGGARQATAAPVQCRCGCGATVTKRYRMGHDARHVTQLAKAVLAGQINRRSATAKLDSDALRTKLVRQLETAAAAAALAGAKSKSDKAGKSTSAGSGESK